MSKDPPILRNLTSLFVKFRDERIGLRHRAEKPSVRDTASSRSHPCPLTDAPQTGQRLLGDDTGRVRGVDGEVAVEMQRLPPQWMSSATDAREDIKHIREKIVQLRKLQEKRLLKVFSDDGAPDQEVEAISNQIGSSFRQCEQRIYHLKTRAGISDGVDGEVRQNVQRSLATQLKDLSQQFKQVQQTYLKEIRQRQHGAVWTPGPDVCGGGSIAGSPTFSETEWFELDTMEQTATQRSEEITQIASSVSDLHAIFKELAVLVIDQGTILDRIDYNIEQVVHTSQEANEQLRKAEKAYKSNRAMKCILVLVFINLVLLAILIFKARHS